MDHILRQIDAASPELLAYGPSEVDWHERAIATSRLLVPWLEENAHGLASYVSSIMNSPSDVRQAASDIATTIASSNELTANEELLAASARLQSSLDAEELLITNAGGTIVSKLIERYLISEASSWRLESNGASDYPDLFVRDFDYTFLPRFVKKSDQSYGSSLKGKMLRPVRVPDGLEIKTCKGRFAVDCHHAHAGLHLVLLFEKSKRSFSTTDVQVGFMRHDFYRLTDPKSPTTTLKASFNGEHFVSLLHRNNLMA